MTDINYLDPEQFNNVNEKLDFKFILMRQIDKVRVARSTEMRGGYWEDRPMPAGGGMSYLRVYVPDTRETYINSVKNLRSLLIPYWDKQFLKQEEKLEEIYEKECEEKAQKVEEMHKKENREPDWTRYNEWLERYKITHYDFKFEVLLKLCQRAKLIGGNNLVTDEV